MKQTKLEQQKELLDNFGVDDFCGGESIYDYCMECGFNDVKADIKIKELLEAKEAVVRAEIEELLDKAGTFGWNSYRDDMNSREFNNELKHYIKSLLAEQ